MLTVASVQQNLSTSLDSTFLTPIFVADRKSIRLKKQFEKGIGTISLCQDSNLDSIIKLRGPSSFYIQFPAESLNKLLNSNVKWNGSYCYILANVSDKSFTISLDVWTTGNLLY